MWALVVLSAAVAGLTACGDHVTEVKQVNTTVGIDVLASGDQLNPCTKDNVGEVVFVADSNAVFYCADGMWQNLKGAKGETGDPGEPGDKGEPGEPGEKGDAGESGSSCKAETVKGGIGISCDGKPVGILSNGKNGTNGKDGLSCSAFQNEGQTETTIICEKADGGTDTFVIKNGENGEDGEDGKSAYELSGTDKTLEEWLASLKGEPGDKGDKGDDGDNGLSCSVSQNAEATETTITCEKADGTKDSYVVKNGKDGENGKNGENGKSAYELSGSDKTLEEWLASLKGENGKNGEDGKDGLSCSASQNSDKTETTITCEKADGTTESFVVKNGEDGKDGKDGKPGAGCSILKDEGGVVEVVCGEGDDAVTTTLYKAMCGAKPYDPAVDFCLNGKPYPLCKGSDYDPTVNACYEDELYSCDGKPYNPTVSFCYERKLYSCDGKAYNPETQWCVIRGTTEKVEARFIDSRDAQNYRTVSIGGQVWMADNLNYNVNHGTDSWCGGGNERTDEGDCWTYGRVYSWTAAVGITKEECAEDPNCSSSNGNIQGICPDGWHIPSNEEWTVLFENVGGKDHAGKVLKSGWLWKDNMGDDTYGFWVLPAGYYNISNIWYYECGLSANFWSSSLSVNYYERCAQGAYLESGSDAAKVGCIYNNYAVSVRCVKD